MIILAFNEETCQAIVNSTLFLLFVQAPIIYLIALNIIFINFLIYSISSSSIDSPVTRFITVLTIALE